MNCPHNLSMYNTMSVFFGIEHWWLSNYCCRLHIIFVYEFIEFSPVIILIWWEISMVSMCIWCITNCRWTLDIYMPYALSISSIFSHFESLSHRECLSEEVRVIIAFYSSRQFVAFLSNWINQLWPMVARTVTN